MKWKFARTITTLTLSSLLGLATVVAPASAQSREFFSHDKLIDPAASRSLANSSTLIALTSASSAMLEGSSTSGAIFSVE